MKAVELEPIPEVDLSLEAGAKVISVPRLQIF